MPSSANEPEVERLRDVAALRLSCRQPEIIGVRCISSPSWASQAGTFSGNHVVRGVLTLRMPDADNRPLTHCLSPTESPQVRVLRGVPHKKPTDNTVTPGTAARIGFVSSDQPLCRQDGVGAVRYPGGSRGSRASESGRSAVRLRP